MENDTEANLTPEHAPINQFVACIVGANGFIILIETTITIATILRTPSLNSNETIFVFSLAITDCAVGISNILYVLLYPFPHRVSYKVFNIIVLLAFYMCTVSLVHLALIAVDRCLCVAKPFFYETRITRGVTIRAVIVTWVVCIIVLSIMTGVSVARGDLNHKFANFTANTLMLIVVTVVYLCCSVIIVASYVIILRIAVRQRRAISSIARTSLNQNSLNPGQEDDGGRKRWRNAMKSVKFFLVVCGAFFICISTLTISGIVNRFHDVPKQVFSVGNLLAMLNSGMNPVIYAVMNKQFRNACKKTCSDFFNHCLQCCPCKKKDF